MRVMMGVMMGVTMGVTLPLFAILFGRVHGCFNFWFCCANVAALFNAENSAPTHFCIRKSERETERERDREREMR
jgi:hypothetical protein